MIGKIMKNSSFLATTKYVIAKQGAKLIGGNMVANTAPELAAEFAMSRNLKPLIKRPVYHISLGLPLTEALSDEQFADLATCYLSKMGLDPFENQFFIARHTDTDHDHIHIVASRINVCSGAVVDDGFERYRSQKILRELEQEYHLSVLQNSWEVGQGSETIEQIKTEEKTGVVSIQKRLQSAIEEAVNDSPTMPDLIERLQSAGIGVKVEFTRTGKSKGISYCLDGVAFAGNKLGSRYSFPGLSQRLGVSYEPERDNALITELCERTIQHDPKLGTDPQVNELRPDNSGDATNSNLLMNETLNDDRTDDSQAPVDLNNTLSNLLDSDNFANSIPGNTQSDIENSSITPSTKQTVIQLTSQQQILQAEYDCQAEEIRALAKQPLTDWEVDVWIVARSYLPKSPYTSQRAIDMLGRSPETQRIKREQGKTVALKYIKGITQQGQNKAEEIQANKTRSQEVR